MKINNQFTTNMAIFGAILVIITTSVIYSNGQVAQIDEQRQIADNVQQGINDLQYLSNDYLLYHEQQQRIRWETKFTAVSTEVEKLKTFSPEQQVLVSNIKTNLQRLNAVFIDVSETFENQVDTQEFNLVVLQISWSRIAVQTQGIAFDAQQLSQIFFGAQEYQKQINLTLIFGLLGVFVTYFFTSYFIVNRRVLKSITELNKGTKIIGSGDFDYRIQIDKDDETGELAQAFNEMTTSLKKVTASKIELEKEVEARKKITDELRASEERLRTVYLSMIEGLATHDIIYENGKAVDYIVTDVNPSYEKITGLTRESTIGKKASELYGTGNPPYLDIYAKVTADGTPYHFETYFQPMDRHFSISVFSPGNGKFATVFSDISERKKNEEAISRLNLELEKHVDEIQKTNEMLKSSRQAALNIMEDALQARDALHESEERFRIISQASPVHISVSRNSDGTILYTNQAYNKAFGYNEQELIGRKAPDLYVEPKDRTVLMNIITERGFVQNYEVKVKKKDNVPFWVSASITPIQFAGEKAFLGASIDITERKKVEEKLHETSDYLENLLNYANAPIIVWDKDFNIVRFNHAFEHFTGYASDTIIGKKLDVLFPKTSKKDSVQKIQKTLIGEFWETVEIPILRKDGDIKIALWNSANIYDNTGKNLIATIAQGTDITERKEAEKALLKAKQEWERTFDSVPDLIAILDENHKIMRLNKAMARRLGVPPEQCIGLNCYSCVHGTNKPPGFCPHTQSLKDGMEHSVEVHEDKFGGDFLITTTPIHDEQGTLVGNVHVARDITESKRNETELLRLASFPLKNPNPIVEIDLSGIPQYLNPTAQRLFPELEKKGINHQFLNGVKKIETDIRNKNNAPVLREVQLDDTYYLQTITYIPETKHIRIYSVDITQRKQTEKVLQESEEKYRRIVENTTNVIMVTQPDGIISYLSPSSKEIFRYSPEELIGTNPNIFHPEDVQKVQQSLSKSLKGEKGKNFEYRILTKTGDVKWVSHSWSPIIFDNKLHSIVSIIEDITERKTTEHEIIKLNENLLRRSNELILANKELETFSYSVSHDLRAPLRSIDGFSQALLEDYGKILDETGKEYINRVRKSTHRMAQLIDDMLRLSRLTRVEMNIQKVDLSQLSSSIIDDYKKTEPERKIKFIINKEMIADGDANLLHILLENLLGNAWKFTKKRENAEIRFGKTKQGQETVFFIRDNGAGFNMKYADKLFIPFQRLHDETDYPGTGIGLGIVSRIIHRHGGRIWAEAEENKGATFYFTLGGKTK